MELSAPSSFTRLHHLLLSAPSSFTSDVFVTENNANHNLICFFVQREKKRIKLWLALFFEQKKTGSCHEWNSRLQTKSVYKFGNFNHYSMSKTDYTTFRDSAILYSASRFARFGGFLRLAIRFAIRPTLLSGVLAEHSLIG